MRRIHGMIIILIHHISVWIASDGTNPYPLQNSSFSIKTESATGSDGVLYMILYNSRNLYITTFKLRFKDLKFFIAHCTKEDFLPLSEVPENVLNKTWEVTATPEDVTIKCNGAQVFHFIYSNIYDPDCSIKVKGKEATIVRAHMYNDVPIKIYAKGE